MYSNVNQVSNDIWVIVLTGGDSNGPHCAQTESDVMVR